MPHARIGISGWTYGPWRGVFYPEGLPARRELEYAGRQFNSIEINGSFYRLQRPGAYQEWYRQTPRGFRFAVKGGRFITHMKKLRDVRTPLANFFASGVLCLREKLGPILWQFGGNLGYDPDRFESFFALLPRDTEQAAELAKQHNEKLRGDVWTQTDRKRPLRYAVEIRKDSFLVPAFIDLLRRHNIVLVFADTAGTWPYTEDVTAGDLVYIRLHGAERLYWSGYTRSQLQWWADRIACWMRGSEPADARRVSPAPPPKSRRRDAYVYFDNDANVRAPFDALELSQLVATEAHTPPGPGVGGPTLTHGSGHIH